jgi:hypothetical protein
VIKFESVCYNLGVYIYLRSCYFLFNKVIRDDSKSLEARNREQRAVIPFRSAGSTAFLLLFLLLSKFATFIKYMTQPEVSCSACSSQQAAALRASHSLSTIYCQESPQSRNLTSGRYIFGCWFLPRLPTSLAVVLRCGV